MICRLLDFGLLLELGLIEEDECLLLEEQHNISLLWAGNLDQDFQMDAYYTERQIFEEHLLPQLEEALGLSFPRMRIRNLRSNNPVRHKIELLRHSIDEASPESLVSVAEIEKRNPGFEKRLLAYPLIKYGLNVMIPVYCVEKGHELYNVHAIVAGEDFTDEIQSLIHNFTKRKLHLVDRFLRKSKYANVLKQKNYKTEPRMKSILLVRLAHQICMINPCAIVHVVVVSVVGLLRS
ncbi:hypothetical protein SPFM7_00114 [Salmonella phage SPFM7]|nr:hypothetical protein SPFM7_00114 [Salmonella phage SPFM7]